MIIFLDTEFTGLQQSSQLISLALVDMDGRWFYAEFTDYDDDSLTDWHRKYVVANLFLEKKAKPSFLETEGQSVRGNSELIVTNFKKWLSHYDETEIWADVLTYDWMLFCELFGGALHIPKSIFYIPYDFATLLKVKGYNPDITRASLVPGWAQQHLSYKHNALYDAFLLRQAYLKLMK